MRIAGIAAKCSLALPLTHSIRRKASLFLSHSPSLFNLSAHADFFRISAWPYMIFLIRISNFSAQLSPFSSFQAVSFPVSLHAAS